MSPSARVFDIRNTRTEDFPGIIALCGEVYKYSSPWTEQQLASHLKVFPEGQFVAVHNATGRIVGMAATLVVFWDEYEMTGNWRDFTDGGLFTNHDPVNGRTLYGAEIMTSPEFRRRGIAGRLYQRRFELARTMQLLRIRAGARLPGYHKHSARLTPEQYVEQVVRGKLNDPTLSFQLRYGFHVLAVVTGYLQHDPESLGYAAVIEWLNPQQATAADWAKIDPRFRPAQMADPRLRLSPAPQLPAGPQAANGN